MAEIDDWLAQAAGSIPTDLSVSTFTTLEQRLDGQPSPVSTTNRRETRRAMLCAGFAAVVGFCGISAVNGWDDAQARPTWIAAPSQSSPYSLLIGR